MAIKRAREVDDHDIFSASAEQLHPLQMLKADSSQKPFVCTYKGCTKAFNRRDYLRRHAANHLEVKPFVCEPCGKHFARNDLYENHLTTKLHSKRTNAREAAYYGSPTSFSIDNTIKPDSTTGNTSPVTGYFNSSASKNIASQLQFKVGRSPFNSLPNTMDQAFPSNFFMADDGAPSPINSSSILAGTNGLHALNSADSFQTSLNPSLESECSSYTPSDLSNSTHSTALEVYPGSFRSLIEQPMLRSNNHSNSNRTASYQEPGISTNDNFSAIANDQHDFAWLFDDRDIKFSFSRYDIDYMYKLRYYESRATSLGLKRERPGLPEAATIITPEKLNSVLKVLCCHPDTPGPAQLGLNLTPSSVSAYITMVWENVHSLQHFLHPNGFYAETECDHLLAMMIILGMSMSSIPTARQLASKAVVSIFSSVRAGLSSRQYIDLERDVGFLQTFCLLVRFEHYIHLQAGTPYDPSEQNPVIERKWLIEKFLWFIVPRADPGATVNAATHAPLKYARVLRSGYEFHKGVDPKLAWREWVAYETCKRATFFALYCDCIQMLNGYRTESAMSLFSVDIHMPCTNCLWLASNEVEFFQIIGTPVIVNNVPYLYVLKSVFRLPRLGEEELVLNNNEIDKNVWSMFTLMMLLYGLLSVSRQMTGVFKTVENVLHRLQMINHRSKSGFNLYGPSAQERLSRAFDIWNHYFDNATGLHENSYPFLANSDVLPCFSSNSNLKRSMSQAGSILSQKRRVENASIMGILQSNTDSVLYADYILLSLLHNHAAQILMYDDLILILSAANNLPLWLASYRTMIPSNDPREMLSRFMEMQEYDNWACAYGARTMIATACLYLVRCIPATRLVTQNRAMDQVLGVFTYYCVVMIWIYSLTLPKNHIISSAGTNTGLIPQNYHIYEKEEGGDRVILKPRGKAILADARRYLFYVWQNTQQGDRPMVGHDFGRGGESVGNSFTSELLIYDDNGHLSQIITSRCLIALGWYILQTVKLSTRSQPGSETFQQMYEELYLNGGIF